MSIVFVPKIAYSFAALKPARHEHVVEHVLDDKIVTPRVITVKPISEAALREYNSWSVKELTIMVNLRAIGMSYRSIARHIHRSQDACAIAFNRNDLKDIYKGIRAKLIEEVLLYEKGKE